MSYETQETRKMRLSEEHDLYNRTTPRITKQLFSFPSPRRELDANSTRTRRELDINSKTTCTVLIHTSLLLGKMSIYLLAVLGILRMIVVVVSPVSQPDDDEDKERHSVGHG